MPMHCCKFRCSSSAPHQPTARPVPRSWLCSQRSHTQEQLAATANGLLTPNCLSFPLQPPLAMPKNSPSAFLLNPPPFTTPFLLAPAAPEELVMPKNFPQAPPPLLAALLAPLAWTWGAPDLFDSYSAGVVLMQVGRQVDGGRVEGGEGRLLFTLTQQGWCSAAGGTCQCGPTTFQRNACPSSKLSPAEPLPAAPCRHLLTPPLPAAGGAPAAPPGGAAQLQHGAGQLRL